MAVVLCEGALDLAGVCLDVECGVDVGSTTVVLREGELDSAGVCVDGKGEAGACSMSIVLCEEALDFAGVGVDVKGGAGAGNITVVLSEGVSDSADVGVDVKGGVDAGNHREGPRVGPSGVGLVGYTGREFECYIHETSWSTGAPLGALPVNYRGNSGSFRSQSRLPGNSISVAVENCENCS